MIDDQLANLYQTWRRTDRQFVSDGVANEQVYLFARVKIMTLMKESQ